MNQTSINDERNASVHTGSDTDDHYQHQENQANEVALNSSLASNASSKPENKQGQTPEDAFAIMEEQFEREKMSVPRAKTVYAECVSFSMHKFNQAIYYVTQGCRQITKDEHHMRPEGYLDSKVHEIDAEFRQIKEEHTNFDDQNIEDLFAEGETEAQTIAKHSCHESKEDEKCFWVMIASVDAPDDLCLQQSVSCNDQVAFKIEKNVVKFFKESDYQKIIHCSSFSPYWCYFTKDNGEDNMTIYVSGGLLSQAKFINLDGQARAAVESVLDDTNSEAGTNKVHHDVPLFSLVTVEQNKQQTLVLIINDQSKDEEQITICTQQKSKEKSDKDEGSVFEHKKKITGVFLQQVSDNCIVVQQEGKVHYISLVDERDKTCTIEDIPEGEKFVNGLITRNNKQLCLVSESYRYTFYRTETNVYKKRQDKQKLESEKSFFIQESQNKICINSSITNEDDGNFYKLLRGAGHAFEYEVKNETSLSPSCMVLSPDNWVMGLITENKKLALYLAKAAESKWTFRKGHETIRPGPRLSNPIVLEPNIIYVVNQSVICFDMEEQLQREITFCDNLNIIRFIEDPVHRNQESNNKTTFRRRHPSVEAIFSHGNSFFFATLDLGVEATRDVKKMNPRLHSAIKFTSSQLRRLLKKDHLLSASRVGERSDRTFVLLFKNHGLVVTNFKDYCHDVAQNTNDRSIQSNLIPFNKTATRSVVLYVQKDSEKVDNRVYYQDRFNFEKKTKPTQVLSFQGQVIQFSVNEDMAFIFCLDANQEPVIHILEFLNDSFRVKSKLQIKFTHFQSKEEKDEKHTAYHSSSRHSISEYGPQAKFGYQECSVQSLIANECVFHDNWFTSNGHWFVIGDNVAIQVYSVMSAGSDYPSAHAYTSSYGYERVMHVTEDHFLIRNQLHSRIAYSRPLIHRQGFPTQVGFISSSTFVHCHKDGKVHVIRRGKRQKLQALGEQEPLNPELCMVGTDAEDGLEIFIKAQQEEGAMYAFTEDENETQLDLTKKHELQMRYESCIQYVKEQMGFKTEVQSDIIKNPIQKLPTNNKWNKISQSNVLFKKRLSIVGKKPKMSSLVDQVIKADDSIDVLLRNNQKFHVVLLDANKNLYKEIDHDSVVWRTWSFDRNHNDWDVRQTEKLIILERDDKSKFEIYRKDQSIVGQAPQIMDDDKFKSFKILEASDYIIEFQSEHGRFLFDAENQKFIEYYEYIDNDKEIQEPKNFPFFNRYSNQKFIDRKSRDCLLNLEQFDHNKMKDHIQTYYRLEKFFSFIEYAHIRALYDAPNDAQAGLIIDAMTVDQLFITFGNNMSFFRLFRSDFGVIKIIHELVNGTCPLVEYESPRLAAFQQIDVAKLAMTLNRKNFLDESVLDQCQVTFPIFEKILELQNMCSKIPIEYNFERLFDYLIENQSGPVLNYLNTNFINFDLLRNIDQKYWTSDDDTVLLQSSSPFIVDEEVQSALGDVPVSVSENMNPIDVQVTRLSFTLDNYKDIIVRLSEIKDREEEDIFQQKQITILIDFLWDNFYLERIKWRVAYPFIASICVIMIQYIYFLHLNEEAPGWFMTIKTILALCNLVLSGHSVFTEYQQMKEVELVDYIDFWNIVNLIQIALNLVTVGLSFMDLEKEAVHDLYSLAAISMFLSFVNVFYAMRVSDDLAWFIALLGQTITDLKSMMIVYTITLITFGSTMSLLNMGLPSDDQFLNTVTPFTLVNSFGMEYLVSLGQFNPDYTGYNAVLAWLFFLMATFISMVIFMNMIIAQMSDTFEDCSGKQTIIIYQSRVQLMRDFVFVVDKAQIIEEEKNEKYLFVIEKIQAEGMETGSVEGKISQMQRIFEREIRSVKTAINANQKETRALIKQGSEKNEENKNKIVELNTQFTGMERNLDDMIKTLKEVNHHVKKH